METRRARLNLIAVGRSVSRRPPRRPLRKMRASPPVSVKTSVASARRPTRSPLVVAAATTDETCLKEACCQSPIQGPSVRNSTAAPAGVRMAVSSRSSWSSSGHRARCRRNSPWIAAAGDLRRCRRLSRTGVPGHCGDRFVQDRGPIALELEASFSPALTQTVTRPRIRR